MLNFQLIADKMKSLISTPFGLETEFMGCSSHRTGIRNRQRGRSDWALAAILFMSLAPALAPGQSVKFPERPDVGQGLWIVDQANLIAEAEADEINALAGALMNEEQVPLLIVTIPSLMEMDAAHFTIERYASELFDAWGIGSERRNYGMLLLVSRGDRKARIELGQGWGGQHDADAERVMQTLIIPSFREDRYSEGIMAGARGMDAMARGLALPQAKAPWWLLPAIIGVGILLIAVIISLFNSGRHGWGWALIAALGVLLFFLIRSSRNSGGSGGTFGGGRSGGGGATGSW
jgi:uncharacterized protein